MISLPGYWLLDNIDLWNGFRTGILRGTSDFLQYAPKKMQVEYDWLDQHGIDVDLSAPKFAARQINLHCFIHGNTTAEFFENYTALINQLMMPGVHSFTINAHGPKAYSVEYLETQDYRTDVSLKLSGIDYTLHTFTLVLRELEPNPGASITRVVDDQDRLIVT